MSCGAELPLSWKPINASLNRPFCILLGAANLERPILLPGMALYPHHSPLILASPRVPLATNNTMHNSRVAAMPHLLGRRSCVSSLLMFTPGIKTGQVRGYGVGTRPGQWLLWQGEDVSPWHLFVSGFSWHPVVIISGNTTAPHSFSAFIELRRTRDMINFTAVMRYSGFVVAGFRPGMWTIAWLLACLGTTASLSQWETRNGANDQWEARDCAWEDGRWAVLADRR